MSHFWKFYQNTNYSIISQCTQIQLLTTLVKWIQLIPKFLQLLLKLMGKVLRGYGTYEKIYKKYNQLIYPNMFWNFQGNNFRDKISQFGRWKSPWVLEQLSSQHCTNFTNGGYDTWIYYQTLIKLYLKHHMWFWGWIGIQENSINLLVVLRFQPPIINDSK